MFAEERREKIYDLLNVKERVSVKDLAEQFHISIDSIRRDLSIMESRGLLKRTYGGAIPAIRAKLPLKPPASRLSSHVHMQREQTAAAGQNAGHHADSIAKTAASYVRSGDTIFLGNHPVHFAILLDLPDQMPITVVTNNLQMAETAKQVRNIETYMICGKVQSSGDVFDSFAQSFVRTIKIDVHFLGGCGVSSGYGISTATPEEAAFHRTLAEISRTTICLAGHREIGGEMFARMMPLDSADLIIADPDADQEEIERIRTIGTEVVIAAAS